jgi:hypothetical protein
VILRIFLSNLGSSDSDLDTNWEDDDENRVDRTLPSSSDSIEEIMY